MATNQGLIRKLTARKQVIPVLTVDDPDDALPLAQALVSAGMRYLEVTLRTEAALDAVRMIAGAVHRATVGVGTVTRRSDLERAIRARAAFAVSPGTTADLLVASGELGLPLIPGVATPSEAMAAAEAGFPLLKLFPAAPLGAADYLRALAGPLPSVKFCPTGGLTFDTFEELLALPNVPCVGGSWMVPKAALEAKDWDAVRVSAKKTQDKVRALRDA
ncbi:MAG: bifunctional 4-hydroxy-2-oxoglutarate aldolase/2-dehydro-3-deoxy-phosphogluconate aldolase [Thermoanaerobaculia bacterium]|nr:bifunctional 4-hydroxy-2-oxoglutarate aldolase/2-dehydro-3-deoxy-phosphogluconate aldolase [Thermoanaerobaculia bacterium]